MNVPRRYRLALCAYPAGYREARGRELLATLADGDDERGRPSSREAFALAWRGLLQRGQVAVSGDGLLVIAAALVMFTMLVRLTWTEHIFLYRGRVGVTWTEVLGTWTGAALFLTAFTVFAAGPFRAAECPRRRRKAAAIAFLAALVLPGLAGALKYRIPGIGELLEILRWHFAGIYHNWRITLPFAGTAAAGTWLALLALSRLRPAWRTPAMAAGLAVAGAVAVSSMWMRPDVPADYGRSAFADLGAAAFVTGASVLLALAAVGRSRSSRAHQRPS